MENFIRFVFSILIFSILWLSTYSLIGLAMVNKENWIDANIVWIGLWIFGIVYLATRRLMDEYKNRNNI